MFYAIIRNQIKLISIFILSALAFTQASEDSNAPSQKPGFDYFSEYHITDLHQKGLTGKGYMVSIIESSADITHPALLNKVFLNPSNRMEDNPHGNLVAALIVGNETDQFVGGIAPEAKATLFQIGRPYISIGSGGNTEECMREQAIAHKKTELDRLKQAAQTSHIINMSSAPGARSFHSCSASLDDNDVEDLAQALEDNDTILIITASNDLGIVGYTPESGHLLTLLKNPKMRDRFLIVANLRKQIPTQIEATKNQLETWMSKIYPCLEGLYLENFLSEEDYKKSPLDLIEYVNFIVLNRCFPNEMSDLEKEAYGKFSKTDIMMSNRFMFNGKTLPMILEERRQIVERNLSWLPQHLSDNELTGTPVSMAAGGIAQDDVIFTLGVDINSAWRNKEYAIETGSSQAAPITTGIIVLLHQHRYGSPDVKGSWKEVLKYVKQNAKQIGDPLVFGLGILDTAKLFPDLL